MDTKPHQYYLDVLKHYGATVHKYYTKYYDIYIGEQYIDGDKQGRYNFFMAYITYDNCTGYIFGPQCSGCAGCFPHMYFNGYFHDYYTHDDVSDLEDHPKEYDESKDIKESILLKTFNNLTLGFRKKEFATTHLDIICDGCKKENIKGFLYICEKTLKEKNNDESDDYDECHLCEDCYGKEKNLYNFMNYKKIDEPKLRYKMFNQEETLQELENRYNKGARYKHYCDYTKRYEYEESQILNNHKNSLSSNFNILGEADFAYTQDGFEKLFNEIHSFVLE